MIIRSFLFTILFLMFGMPVEADDIVNDISQLNPIRVDRIVTPTSVDSVSKLVAAHKGPISIGGGRFSQGGQIATDGALFIDMRHMNRILKLDAEAKLITVEAGATWRDIQEAIDPLNLSVRTMQSFSNFTVGGSLSVNGHGRYVGRGALIHSVKSIRLVLADGSVKVASRMENPDLFHAAIGGYGGIGVIVDATLGLDTNQPVERHFQRMPVASYKDYFITQVKDSPLAVFHNGILYPPFYTHIAAVTWSTTDKPVTLPDRLAPRQASSPLNQSLQNFMTSSHTSKQAREYVFDPLSHATNRVVWRNYEASYDVTMLEPASREKVTYVLQEYFVPVDSFDIFIKDLSAILMEHRANVLNVSIRHAPADTESWLSWSPRDVFSFVIYYAQGTSEKELATTKVWTAKLIDSALRNGGTYYLPYQIVASKDQFLQAYPQAPRYFSLKQRLDPTYKFRNRLWDAYCCDGPRFKVD